MNQATRARSTVAWPALLIAAFIAAGGAGHFLTRDALAERIAEETLPLASEQIRSAIERDLLQAVLASSRMAHDPFIRDWSGADREEPEPIVRHLGEIQAEHEAMTAFFVSERSHRYYHPSGVVKTIDREDPDDGWYFRVREMDDPYEVNVDPDTADPSRLGIFVNHRVRNREGDYLGVTGIGLSVDAVGHLLDESRDDRERPGRAVYFVDREGGIRLRVGDVGGPDRIQDRPGLQRIAKPILAGTDSALRYTDDAGDTVHVSARLIPELDWYLVVEQPARLGPDGARTLMPSILAALGIALAVLAGRRFVRRGTRGG